MKKILIIICFVSISACAQKKDQKANQELNQEKMKNTEQETMKNTDPEKVVKALIEAMKVNDAEKIRSLFNANASQAYGDAAAKSGKAFFSWLESDIIVRKGHVDNAGYAVDGNQVVVNGQYSSEGYTNKANFLFSVKDGQIMSWQMRY